MKVYVKLLLGELSREEEKIELSSGSTVEDVLRILSERHGQEFDKLVFNKKWEIFDYLILLINGKDISHFQGRNTKLTNDDKIAIILTVGGG